MREWQTEVYPNAENITNCPSPIRKNATKSLGGKKNQIYASKRVMTGRHESDESDEKMSSCTPTILINTPSDFFSSAVMISDCTVEKPHLLNIFVLFLADVTQLCHTIMLGRVHRAQSHLTHLPEEKHSRPGPDCDMPNWCDCMNDFLLSQLFVG